MTTATLGPAVAAVRTCVAAVDKKSKDLNEFHRHILESNNFSLLWDAKERVQFYLWFYEQILAKKHEVRWPLAAAIVAYQVHLGYSSEAAVAFGASSQQLQAFLRRGSQVIFDDVLHKLRDLWQRPDTLGPLIDQAAINWDSGLLSEEQHLIQPLYLPLTIFDRERLKVLAAQTGVFVTAGIWFFDDTVKQVLTGLGRRPGKPKPFTKNLLSVADRWRFGMDLGASASTLIVDGTIPPDPPTPPPEYLPDNGAALAKVDTRPGLHLFEALTDSTLSAGTGIEIGDLMRNLGASEQKLFLSEPRFVARARTVALAWKQMVRGIGGFRVDLFGQLELLDSYQGDINWWLLDTKYDEVRPMILAAPADQRAEIRGPRWRKVFVDICDKTTIITAVDDLGLVNPERQEWIDAEHNLL